MISGFNITESEWENTPHSVRIAAASLQHQLYLLNARFQLYQQYLAASQTQRLQLEQTNTAQAAQIKGLQTEVAKLKESLGLNSSNSSLPPSSDSPFQKLANNRQPSGRKQGAPAGHEGVGRWLLDPEDIDEIVELRPDHCTRCGGVMFEPFDWFLPARRQVTEITISGTRTNEYQCPALRCSSCGKRNRAAWPTEVSVGAFGARVKAVIGYLTGRLGASHRDTVDAMKELFGVKISLGSISAVQRRISNALARPVAQLQQLVELWHPVRDGTLQKPDFRTAIKPIERGVKQLLIEGTKAENSKTKNTCQNILKLEDSLWTFTRVKGVEPTNNAAERALRRAVIWRRKSFGTQSETGSRFVARILTVVTTLRQQGRSVLEFLTKACRITVETTLKVLLKKRELSLLSSVS